MASGSIQNALKPTIGAVVFGAVAVLSDAPGMVTLAAVAAGAMLGAMFGRGRPPENVDKTPAAPQADVTPAHEDPETPALQALEHLPFGIVIIGQDRTILFVNRIAGAMFGIRGGEDQPDSTLRTRRLLDQIDQVFLEGKSSILNFTLSRMGDANMKAHLRPLDSGDLMIAIEDETQAQRAGAMHRDFVANASHELKTPLAAIQGVIETLLGHARNDQGATERFLELLQAQANRMTRLVEDLLSLNRIELNERVQPEETHELLAIVNEAIDALRPIGETQGVAFDIDLPDAKIWVLSDRDELGQLFGNLIDNAIKYGGKGTTVGIGTRQSHADTSGMIGIEVTDEGPGIAREHIPRLTERFYRVNVGASRAKGGTGLGLAIVKHILSRHKGRIEIESTPGHGSCFRIWLPVVKRSESLSENPRGTREQERTVTNEIC